MVKNEFEIRADYDRDTIVVYQAYNELIAKKALANGKFTTPFSFNRMTWIKPSFLWMMERSGYATKGGQEFVLGIRIKRSAWESALSEAVLTHPDARVYPDGETWRALFDKARIHVQWDPERNLRGGKLEYRSIQIGISRFLIEEYNNEWITEIRDYTPLVRKINEFRKRGEYDRAKKFLPIEKIYPISEEIKKRLAMNG